MLFVCMCQGSEASDDSSTSDQANRGKLLMLKKRLEERDSALKDKDATIKKKEEMIEAKDKVSSAKCTIYLLHQLKMVQ